MTSPQEHKIRRPLNRQVLNGSQGIGTRIVSGVCGCRFAEWRVMGPDPHYIGERCRHNTRYGYHGNHPCQHSTSRFSVDFFLISCYGQSHGRWDRCRRRWDRCRIVSLSPLVMNNATFFPVPSVPPKLNNMKQGSFSLHRATFPCIISLVLICTAHADGLADKGAWMNNHKTRLWDVWNDVSPDAGVGFLTRNVTP